MVWAVVDPRGGLPSKSQFLPTVFEVTQACEARMKPLYDAERRLRQQREAERDRPSEITTEEAERRKQFAAKWREHMAGILESAAP